MLIGSERLPSDIVNNNVNDGRRSLSVVCDRLLLPKITLCTNNFGKNIDSAIYYGLKYFTDILGRVRYVRLFCRRVSHKLSEYVAEARFALPEPSGRRCGAALFASGAARSFLTKHYGHNACKKYARNDIITP